MCISRRIRSGAPPLAVTLALFSSCASPMNEMRHTLGDIESEISERLFAEAAATVERDQFYRRKQNRFLLDLDAGGAHFFGGEYREATRHLLRAGELSEKYYTKSLSAHVLSFLVNDLTLPYYGEDYEVTFAAGLAALAFAVEDRYEDALVEARKVEHRLGVMSAAYEGSDKYRDDAFAHYLSGAIYEAAGNLNDAVVSYRRAWEIYGGRFFPMRPEQLRRVLLRSAAATGIDPGIGEVENTAPVDSAGSVLFLAVFTGRGPSKEEVSMEIPFTKDGVPYTLKVAIPVLKTRGSRIASVRATLDDGMSLELESACDYNHIGSAVFADKRPVIIAKTVARLSIRYLALRTAKGKLLEKYRKEYEKLKKEAEEVKNAEKVPQNVPAHVGDPQEIREDEKNGKGEEKEKEENRERDIESRMEMAKLKIEAVSWAIDHLANELLEHADTRCSALCPARAYFAPIPTTPGEHRLLVEYLDASGAVIETVRKAAEIRNGTVVLFCAPY